MTDLLPATLTSRQAPGGVVMPAAPSTPAQQLPELLQLCTAIAGAGDLLMPCYRQKPGAVLLAYLWAQGHGVDPFTALQNIYPINGKAFVSAELRMSLAALKGYDVAVIESDDSVCRLDVTAPRGRTTTVIAHMPDVPVATAPGVIAVHPAPADLRKDTWKDRPSDMLYALACRVADRRLVHSPVALLDAAQDYGVPDALDVLGGAGEGAGAVELAEDDGGAGTPDSDTPQPAPAGEPVTAAYILDLARRHGVGGQVALLKQARAMGWEGGSLADLAADSEWADRLMDWVEDQ